MARSRGRLPDSVTEDEPNAQRTRVSTPSAQPLSEVLHSQDGPSAPSTIDRRDTPMHAPDAPDAPRPSRLMARLTQERPESVLPTVNMACNDEGSLVITTPDFPKTYRFIAGKSLVPDKLGLIRCTSDVMPSDDATISWCFEKFQVRRSGVMTHCWKPVLPVQAAMMSGCSSMHAYVEAHLRAQMRADGFDIVLEGSPVEHNVKIKISTLSDGRVAVTGDTRKLHPGALDFRKFKLRWDAPFWVGNEVPVASMLEALIDLGVHLDDRR
jgi:hypothetical protein